MSQCESINTMETPFQIGQDTDAGRSGKNNEDRKTVFATQLKLSADIRPVQVLVVADGIGGNVAGERASQLACDTIKQVMKDPALAESPPEQRMATAINAANRAIYDEAIKVPTYQGMGTTVVMASLVDNGDHADLTVAHAGDSRAYLLRAEHIHLLTRDHTWAQEAMEAGYLTAEQAAVHPNRSVIKRYLGIQENMEIDQQMFAPLAVASTAAPRTNNALMVDRLTFQRGDALLLCTDGLNDVVSDEQIRMTMLKYPPAVAVTKLIELANAGGGPDNITAVILQWPTAGAAPVIGLPWLRWALPALGTLAVATLFFLAWQQWGGNGGEPNLPVEVAAQPTETEISLTAATPAEIPALSNTPVITVATPTASSLLTERLLANEYITPTKTLVSPTDTPVATYTFLPTDTPTVTPTPQPVPLTEATVSVDSTSGITKTELLNPSGTINSEALPPILINPESGYTVRPKVHVPFSWSWDGELQENWAFEIQVWQDGESHNGIHNAVNDRNAIQKNGRNQYSFAVDVASVRSSGTYKWGVAIIKFDQQTKATIGTVSKSSESDIRVDLSGEPDRKPSSGV
jgi:PPM family protein phosphatase